jgi:hypothetical protein
MNKKLISNILAVLAVLCFIAISFAIDKKNEKEIEKEIDVEQIQTEAINNLIQVQHKRYEKRIKLIKDFEKKSGIKYNPIWKNKDIITEEEVKAEREMIEAELKKIEEKAKRIGLGDHYNSSLWDWKIDYFVLDNEEVMKGFINVWKDIVN